MMTVEARGRAMGVRLRSGFDDLAPIVVHLPPRPAASKQHAHCRKIAKLLINWLEFIPAGLPKGCAPRLFVDVNEEMGTHGRGFCQFDEEAVTVVNRAAAKEKELARRGS
eukprot:TRINITY_DN9016_c0_g3_i3.p2 TRINITY_DN9016_c0_g3~~TRINITY_DN9016_c0_g3_i3.p2  ORF type:complete len:110 (+),score=22.73 TRINITY_DN9016_c0_g3_i3:871-1200(+)